MMLTSFPTLLITKAMGNQWNIIKKNNEPTSVCFDKYSDCHTAAGKKLIVIVKDEWHSNLQTQW